MVHSPVHDVAEGQLHVIAGSDTMLIDLPEDEQPWADRAWRRWDRDTPEVIRFRKGRYTLNDLISGPWADTAANTLARRRIAEEDAAYRKELAELEEYYSNRPPPSPPPVPYTPPPPMTPEQWQAEMAKQPPLREARIIALNGDTVTISFTGRVMLTGGCASNAPTFGIEQRTVSGWVEHFPLDLTQLDCGLPWADWEEHAVTIPLRWWVGNFAPAGRKELKAGTYRLMFMGGNMQEVRSELFTVE